MVSDGRKVDPVTQGHGTGTGGVRREWTSVGTPDSE